MVGHIKNALITTAIVLATIYVVRQVPGAGTFVDKAISG